MPDVPLSCHCSASITKRFVLCTCVCVCVFVSETPTWACVTSQDAQVGDKDTTIELRHRPPSGPGCTNRLVISNANKNQTYLTTNKRSSIMNERSRVCVFLLVAIRSKHTNRDAGSRRGKQFLSEPGCQMCREREREREKVHQTNAGTQ